MTRSVEICMITTPDGVIDVNGRSGPLGGPADQAHFRELRAASAFVLVGAGTAMGEEYGAPSAPGLRIGVVSKSCRLAFDSALFTSGSGIVITSVDAPDVPVPSIRSGTGTVDFAGIIEQLPSGMIHVEGGPMLNTALLDADLVDAINLTVSPQVGGVRGVSISQSPHALRRFTLESLRTEDDFVFLRYLRKK